jgi:sugar/nucleoside kinase (ribokinase family)
MSGSDAVLCVGQIVADVVVRPVDRLPVPGTADLVEDLQLVAGGCAANTACVLAKLGAPTRIAALAGNDPLGDIAAAQVARCGVDILGLVRSAEVPTSAVVVVVDRRGERSFLYRPGGTEALTCEMVLGSLRPEIACVHLGGTLKLRSLDLARFLAAARAPGRILSLDTDWDPTGSWARRLEPAIPLVDVLMTNREEGRELTGIGSAEGIARALLAAGPRTVLVKCGADGAVAAEGKTIASYPAYDVAVMDTTCAGDAFAAGFLYARTRGWPLERAVRIANAAGALATTAVSHRGVTGIDAVLALVEGRARVHHRGGYRSSPFTGEEGSGTETNGREFTTEAPRSTRRTDGERG